MMDTILFWVGALYGVIAAVRMFTSGDDDAAWTRNAIMFLAAATLMRLTQ